MDDELRSLLYQGVLRTTRRPSGGIGGYEADDVIGSMACAAQEQGFEFAW